ncbi:MAG TPA: methyltransferase domain-containing protein [Micromonosporaceae bacterium]
MVELNRQYSPETWDVYELLDRSLDPSGPDSLFDLARSYLAPGARIADVGCRDAGHLIKLLGAHPDITGVGIDPVERHIATAKAAVVASGLGDRLDLVLGTVEDSDLPQRSVDLVWCRDTIIQVSALDEFFVAVARLLKPTGRMIVYSNFVTDRLEWGDETMMRRHLGVVFANMDEHRVLDAYRVAGLDVERTVVIGSEWREWAEERTQPVSKALLQLSRLRRQRDEIIAERGQDLYDHIEAQLHWLLFQFLGKFNPVIHVLCRSR